MHRVFFNTHGSPCSMGLACTSLALALISQRVRTEQEEIQQGRETNTEDFGAETTMDLEKERDADVHSEKENADDMESADDPGEDGEEKDEAEDNEEERDDDLENGVEEQEGSALAIIDPSQKIIWTFG